LRKPEVRRAAAEAGVEGHQAPESQEICFVADDDHRRFLRERLGERPGSIVDLKGTILGSHLGTYNYTIGQRKGLGLSAPEPLYVVATVPDRQQVVVGPADVLDVDRLAIADITWHEALPREGLLLQFRSSGSPVPVRSVEPWVDPQGEGGSKCLTVILGVPARGVARGQTAVIYQDEQVICAGSIVSAWAGGGANECLSETANRTPVV
jgi:tRNA-specific 2-thiouridylase